MVTRDRHHDHLVFGACQALGQSRRPTRREDQDGCRNATTGLSGATCIRQSDHAYTRAWPASSSVPQTDRRNEEKVMARKKDKKAQKDKKTQRDKKTQKTQSAQAAPTTAATAVAPSAGPRPKKS
jgi:hypothetical protein